MWQARRSGNAPCPHTQRVISTTADATHFVNCKGDILIENCRFENMLDDGTNAVSYTHLRSVRWGIMLTKPVFTNFQKWMPTM